MSEVRMTDFEQDQIPFLSPDPPHWAVRGLAYLLILLFFTALLASIFIYIPETVSGSFILVPLRGTDPVRAPHSGIVAEVRVSEGVSVAKDVPLFVIRSQNVSDRTAEMRTLEMQLQGSESKLTNAKTKYGSERLANDQEETRLKGRIAYVAKMIDLKKRESQLARELADRYEKLKKEGIVNEAEYTAHQLDATRLDGEVEQFQTDLKDAEAQVKKIHHEAEAHQAEYQQLEQDIRENLNRDHIRMEALKKELSFSSGDEVKVPAPCNGTVVDLEINAAGAVIQEGESLCEIACSGERLQAQAVLPQSGVVRVKEGQGVKLLYDAFPYQRYGVQFGTVRWVSPAGVTSKQGSDFPVLVDLNDESVMVKGQPQALRPGMKGTAQVVVDRRSLISYAFAPIRQLKENMAQPPEKKRK
jgi:membrane fusion protein